VEPGGHDALVARLLERDEKALRALIDEFGPAVYAVARRIVAEPSLAEEVAQDTFLALWRRPGAFDPARGGLQGFLLGVARNKAVDLVRREESLRRTTEALLADAEPASAPASADENIEGIEERQLLRAAVAQLSQVQREAIVLAYFGGRTYREVAQELGIPEGTAKTRLRDGLTRLRELMGGSRESGG
jgi:RNA polymerase sigma-70 factor (ECF subfamily)